MNFVREQAPLLNFQCAATRVKGKNRGNNQLPAHVTAKKQKN